MAERRRSARFALALPMDAHVSVLHDVQIEQTGPNDIVVMSAAPGVRGEDLTVRIGPSDAVQMTLVGRTIASEPRLVDGRVMHRIQLAMQGSIALSSGVGAAINSWRSGDRSTAVIVRHYRTRILNLSRGGCLLELSIGLAVGTVATLYCGDRSAHAEPMRIDFIYERRGGSWPYVAGAEFLSLAPPSSVSLRTVAARLANSHAEASLADLGEESGLPLTNPRLGPFDLLSIVCAEAGGYEHPNAVVRPPEGQMRAGKPLALVGGRTTGANEALELDD